MGREGLVCAKYFPSLTISFNPIHKAAIRTFQLQGLENSTLVGLCQKKKHNFKLCTCQLLLASGIEKSKGRLDLGMTGSQTQLSSGPGLFHLSCIGAFLIQRLSSRSPGGCNKSHSYFLPALNPREAEQEPLSGARISSDPIVPQREGCVSISKPITVARGMCCADGLS